MLWISQYSIKEKYHNELNILEDISPLGETFTEIPYMKMSNVTHPLWGFFFPFWSIFTSTC